MGSTPSECQPVPCSVPVARNTSSLRSHHGYQDRDVHTLGRDGDIRVLNPRRDMQTISEQTAFEKGLKRRTGVLEG